MSGRLKGKLALVTAVGVKASGALSRKPSSRKAPRSLQPTSTSASSRPSRRRRYFRSMCADAGIVAAFAKDAIRKFGPPDILVNCAGYVHQGSLLACSDEDWDFSFDLNVKSMHRMLRAFIPAMLKNGGGSVVIYLLGGLVDPRRAESAMPMARPKRRSSGSPRPSPPISSARACVPTRSARAQFSPRPSMAALPPSPKPQAGRSKMCAAPSSTGSRSAASAPLRR